MPSCNDPADAGDDPFLLRFRRPQRDPLSGVQYDPLLGINTVQGASGRVPFVGSDAALRQFKSIPIHTPGED
jgi:hypothetical protein